MTPDLKAQIAVLREVLAKVGALPLDRGWMYSSIRHCERNMEFEVDFDKGFHMPERQCGGDIADIVNALPALLDALEAPQEGERITPEWCVNMAELEIGHEVGAGFSTVATPQPQEGETGEQLARRFHETYERLAPSFGYETRTETRQFDSTTPNGKLMIAVCSELAPALVTPQPHIGDQGELVERLGALSDTECDFIDGIAGYEDGFALRAAARAALSRLVSGDHVGLVIAATRALKWFADASEENDKGTDFLNEGGWDDVPNIIGQLASALDRPAAGDEAGLDRDYLALLMLNELRANVSEDQRPMSLSDLSDEQLARARATIDKVLATAPTQEQG